MDALSILPSIYKLDIIDNNIEQLYLIQLKVGICNYYKNKQQILDFYNGRYVDITILNKLNLSNKCYIFWTKNISFIKKGINQSGKFEILFVELVKSNFNYKQIFDRTYLVKMQSFIH